MARVSKLIGEYPNLKRFLEREPDTHAVALTVAHQFRRGRARNAAIKFGTYSPKMGPYLSGANRDLLNYYERRMVLQEAERTSEAIYQLIQDKQIDATLIINNLRESDGMSVEEKAEALEQLTAIENDIDKLTQLLEKISD